MNHVVEGAAEISTTILDGEDARLLVIVGLLYSRHQRRSRIRNKTKANCWKRGVGEYRSMIFTRKDSGLRELADLKGKIIAFEEPFSSTGYFLLKLALVQAGLKLMEIGQPSDPVAATRVGYVFSNEDENTMAWVLRSRVSAGATDDAIFEEKAGSRINELELLYMSAPIPRQIVSYRNGLAENLIAKVKETLLAMDKSAAVFRQSRSSQYKSSTARQRSLSTLPCVI